jgi:hypothetical protein
MLIGSLCGLAGVSSEALAGSHIQRLLPETVQSGVPVGVTNRVAPGEEVLVYVVEETVLSDWGVSRVSDQGSVDVQTGKIKWGPFFDHQPRNLTYRLTPPEKIKGDITLIGQGSFNGESVAITGVTRLRVVLPEGHDAENQVTSSLPLQYVPGGVLTLTNQVRLAEETLVYLVEETIPEGWTTGLINNGGQFDLVQRKIKWGPFSDRVERELRAELKAPAGATNTVRFAGAGSFDGLAVPITGQLESRAIVGTVVSELPAQFQPGEQITVKLTATPTPNTIVFLLEEQTPADWTVQQIGPDGTFDPLHRTIKWGPYFSHDPVTVTYQIKAPPVLTRETATFSGSGSFDGTSFPTLGQRQIAALSSRAIRIMPLEYLATASFTLTNRIIPDQTVGVYVIEDQAPAGWKVGAVSDGGSFDPVTSKVKWGPFLDGAERMLSYLVTPLAGATTGVFQGTASFDGRSISIAGTKQTSLASAQKLNRIVRALPPSVRAGRSIQVTNQVTPGPGLSVQSFEDGIPSKWKASQISDGGAFDEANGKVKWGPFFDGEPRVLTYQLTPAQDASGMANLQGIGLFDGDSVAISGVGSVLAVANHAPLPREDLFQRLPGKPLTLLVNDLLANDSDPDGDPVNLAEIDSASDLGGSLVRTNGIVIYTPPPGVDQTDRFIYTVEDGYGGRAVGLVQIAVIADGASLNRLLVEVLPNGVVRLHFVGIPGRSYRIQGTDSLETPNWTALGAAIAAARGDFEFDDTDALNHRSRFYRTVSP